jgi:hypothetical protein
MSKRSRSHRSRALAQLIISSPNPILMRMMLMESVLTESPLPYDVEHKEDDRDLPFINYNCDSSLDSNESYQLTPSYHFDDTDKDDDTAKVMF